MMECRDGEPLTDDNCQLGMRVRATIPVTDTILAGSVATVTEYHNPPLLVEKKERGPYFVALRVLFENSPIRFNHSSLDYFVVHKH
jgi:hypothetical protein